MLFVKVNGSVNEKLVWNFFEICIINVYYVSVYSICMIFGCLFVES